MNRILRYLLVGIGVVSLLLAAGLFLQLPWATSPWPLPLSRLSNILLTSPFVAIACPSLLNSLTDLPRPLAGGALHLVITTAGLAVFALQLHAQTGAPALLNIAYPATRFVAIRQSEPLSIIGKYRT